MQAVFQSSARTAGLHFPLAAEHSGVPAGTRGALPPLGKCLPACEQGLIPTETRGSTGSFGLCQNLLLRSSLKTEGVVVNGSKVCFSFRVKLQSGWNS